MVNTIKKSLSPVFLITFLLGLGILYPLDELRYRLSIVYILTMWSVYAYALYWAMSVVKNVINSLAVFTIIVNLFVAMISIIITFCEHKKYQQFMKKLEHVDDTLEELETSKEYCRMQNFIRLILITWSVMTCISWIIDSLLCLTVSNDIRAILIPCILNYFTHANTITDITFMLLLRHIGSKLDKINDQIEQLSEIKDYGLSCKWNKYPIVSRHNVQDTDRKRVLWITIHLHSELCRIASNINDFFGMQMTLQMISYFSILIALIYFQLHVTLHSIRIYEIYEDRLRKIILSHSTWFIILLIKLISLNYVCESVSTKAQKTKDIIQKLINFICFADERKDICQFVLQISLRPLKFSGLGLFYFGYGFIRKFFMWMVTAVIFMTQMDPSSLWSGFRNRYNITYYDE